MPSLEKQVSDSLVGAEIAAECPQNGLYVLPELRSQVIHWAYSSCLSYHPGNTRTLFVLRQRFRWPTMDRDVGHYVAVCPSCSAPKTSRLPPVGLLQHLPVPHRPWSDISIDFVTGLPPPLTSVVNKHSKPPSFPLTANGAIPVSLNSLETTDGNIVIWDILV